MGLEIYLTAKQARERFRLSEAGHRAAVKRGNFPAPICLGGKRLWAQSRLDAFERDLLADADRREAKARCAGDELPADFDPLADEPEAPKPVTAPRKMGRPPGSKNQPKVGSYAFGPIIGAHT